MTHQPLNSLSSPPEKTFVFFDELSGYFPPDHLPCTTPGEPETDTMKLQEKPSDIQMMNSELLFQSLFPKVSAPHVMPCRPSSAPELRLSCQESQEPHEELFQRLKSWTTNLREEGMRSGSVSELTVKNSHDFTSPKKTQSTRSQRSNSLERRREINRNASRRQREKKKLQEEMMLEEVEYLKQENVRLKALLVSLGINM